ncbi:hypothetical protein [Mycolicibacterium pyrenivorans]|uniref:hypothetical protein n=1 Tax=Mycolicibacterium pyrenivorans TaxID=187102 RepID=UPI0021F275E0|nr:hypothetical protein [Mycolicibacterium pyrenivorans]MCV7154979.1 hypothetical protein [Mycolicibacterium pyrenivorans]
MPQNTVKLPYCETLIAQARVSGIDLLIGDFNTGNNDLDKDLKESKFIGPEMPGRLIDSGYTDLWRSLHPRQREYSWYSRPGNNGFRLDYIFAAPELTRQAFTCEFDHAPSSRGRRSHASSTTLQGSLERPITPREWRHWVGRDRGGLRTLTCSFDIPNLSHAR